MSELSSTVPNVETKHVWVQPIRVAKMASVTIIDPFDLDAPLGSSSSNNSGGGSTRVNSNGSNDVDSQSSGMDNEQFHCGNCAITVSDDCDSNGDCVIQPIAHAWMKLVNWHLWVQVLH